MCFVTFDSYSLDGRGGAKVLATATTYAECLLDFGIGATVNGRFHHLDSLGRAMLGAVATLNTIDSHDATLAIEYGMTNESHLLLLPIQQVDSSRWAYLATKGTVVKAITLVVTHNGLHHALQTILSDGGLKDMGRAFAHA